MLIPFKNLDPDNQAKCRQNGWIAFDPRAGSYLGKSEGNIGADQRVRYFLSIPGLLSRTIWARSDEEALELVNLGGV